MKSDERKLLTAIRVVRTKSGELLGSERLAGSRVNTDAPACQTGARWAALSITRQATHQARRRKGHWHMAKRSRVESA